MYRTFCSMIFFCLVALYASPVRANDPVIAHSGAFDFKPPGARALGMGAAFIAIADDATAAEANPAGLTALTEPEASLHIRYSSTDSSTLSPSTGNELESSYSYVRPAFASYATPLNNRTTVSFYYQEAADSDSFYQEVVSPDQFYLNAFDFRLQHLGASGAFQLHERVTVGASVRYSRLALSLTNVLPIPSLSDPNSIVFLAQQIPVDEDKRATFNLGLMVKPADKLSIGLVYRQGEDFSLEGLSFVGEVTSVDISTLAFELAPSTKFRMPSTWGLGFALRPNQRWTIGADLVQVNYSEILATPSGIRPEDEIEIHLGTEYTFSAPDRAPFSLRAGYYHSPDHDGQPFVDSAQNYITVGGGLFLKERLQLDMAVAKSEDVTEAQLSMVWHFKRKEN